MDLGDSINVLSRNKEELTPSTQKLLKRHLKELTSAVPIRNRVMHGRPLQFTDLASVQEIEKLLLSFPKELFPTTKEFSDCVRRDPFFPFSIDISQLHDNIEALSHNLPIPDFDETGFLGREQETAQLLSVCKQNWPIITVVAEGGYGKTALALKIAYELLDDPDKPFEAFVWTSSKTSQLSLTDIESIEGAISTSLGLFQELSGKLSGVKSEEKCLDEVLSYLNEFRIFLVIDNLETILDNRIRDFFRRLNGKSKILVTSRVSPGELVYPFPIEGLSESDAVQLLRSTAKVRRVPELVKTKNDILRGYCSKMYWNPGFIKWFVSSVQCGKRPEEALVSPKTFLKFSVTNVYDYVNDDAKMIARAMLAVPGKHAQPVLSYLTNLEGDMFQRALQQLWSANLVGMVSSATETGYETRYELKELPRFYILQYHPPSADEVATFQRRRRELTKIHEQLDANQTNKYDHRYIARRTPDDTVIAKLLSDAFDESAHKNFSDALQLIERAKALDPSFFEIYRVLAMIQNWAGKLPGCHRSIRNWSIQRPQLGSPSILVWWISFEKSTRRIGSALAAYESERV